MNKTPLRERISRVSLGLAQSVVYQVRLGGPPPARPDEATLSAREVARADAFQLAHLRSRFVWCRAALRQILGSFLDQAPAEVALCETGAGRPFVRDASLDFNVSHSHDLALIAVLPGNGSVGVDLERIVEIADLFGLARMICTSHELGQLARQGQRRLASFYRLWTCKEAYLKGIGSGLSAAEATRVEIGVDGPVHRFRRRSPDGRSFSITTFHPEPEFVAALAISAQKS